MNFCYKAPHISITGFVENTLVIEGCKTVNPFTLPLFANGCPTLVFLTKKTCINKQSAGHFTLFGQTIRPGAITISDDFTLIAHFFKPHALVSLFDIPGNELSDTHVDLNLLKQANSTEVQDKLLNCSSVDDMIALLDDYIFKLVSKQKKDHSRIDVATMLIRKNTAADCLKSVQDQLCVTEKTLQRMFENHVGTSPGLYKKICRFNAAFQQLNLKKFLRLSDIAFDNGYADQSHFIRAFKEFTCLTPTQYLNFSTERS